MSYAQQTIFPKQMHVHMNKNRQITISDRAQMSLHHIQVKNKNKHTKGVNKRLLFLAWTYSLQL